MIHISALDAFTNRLDFLDMSNPKSVEIIQEEIAKLDILIEQPKVTQQRIELAVVTLRDQTRLLSEEEQRSNSWLNKIRKKQSNKNKYEELYDLKREIQSLRFKLDTDIHTARVAQVKKNAYLDLLK